MPVDVLIRPFLKELDFEKALADFLPQHGWELLLSGKTFAKKIN